MTHKEKLERFKLLNHSPPTIWEILRRFIPWLLLLTPILLIAKDEIKITVTPRVMACNPHMKYQAQIRVRIEPHPDNRLMILVWASDRGTSGKGFYELSGEKSFKTVTRFVEINCATYNFEACVHRITEGKPVRFCDKQFLEPIGAEEE